MGGYFPLKIYLLIWLHWILVVVHVLFSDCGTWIQFLLSMSDSINSSPTGIKHVSPPLEGRSSTTGPPRKSPGGSFCCEKTSNMSRSHYRQQEAYLLVVI